MADNELQVRLLHAAKTQDQWKAVTSYPKKGEVCLEAINTSGATAFKIKIGDGTRPYCRNTGTTESPVWDFTSENVLPYFGSVIETSGTANVVSISDYTVIIDGSSVTKKKLSFYSLSLSATTTGGSTTLTPTIASTPHLEMIEGEGIDFTTDETGTIKEFYINLEPTSAASDVNLDFEDDFTVITPDSNNRATKRTKYSLPTLPNGNATTTDATSSAKVITSVSETSGVISSTEKTLTEGNKIDITIPTTGTSTGDIIISHEDIDTTATDVASTITTDSSSAVDEKELSIITGIKVDAQGHITHIDKDKSTNLIAADIKASVEKTDDSMWTYRTTAGTTTIVGKDVAEVEELKGKTLKWQQCINIKANTTKTFNGVTFTTDKDTQTVTISGESTSSSDFVYGLSNFANTFDIVTPIIGHHYIYWALGSDNVALYYGYYGTFGGKKVYGATSTNINFQIKANADFSIPVTVKLCAIDLTDLFGAGNEPSTVAEFEALYPLDYYSHTATPVLINNAAKGIVTTGFNQWDEEWENGEIGTTTGQNTGNSYVRSKNFIRCFGSTEFCFSKQSIWQNVRVFQYDIDKNFIKYDYSTSIQKFTLTTESNCAYLRFYTWTDTTYNNDICINLSWSGYRNGEYEPYEQHTLYFNGENGSLATVTGKKLVSGVPTGESVTIFSEGMKSAGSVYDFGKVDSDGYIRKVTKRIGVVDLGTLEWAYISSSVSFIAPLPLTSNNNILICSYYTHSAATYSSNQADKTIRISVDGTKGAVVKDSSYTDAATFKTAMNSVMLYYELKTHEEYLLDTPIPARYLVNDYGTEMLLPQGVDTTTNVPYTVPFSGVIKYQSNFKDVVLDTIDKVNNYKNPVKSKDNIDQTTGKVAVYDSTSTVKSSTFIISNDTISSTGTDNETTIPTVDAVVDYIADELDDNITVTNVTTTDTGTSGLEVTTSSKTKDVHHKTVTQSNTEVTTPEVVKNVITGVTIDNYGHITGKEVISSDKLIAADIKAPMTFTDKDTWLIRPTAGSHDVISEDIAKVVEVEGNSCVWNQLIKIHTTSQTQTQDNVTITDNRDGSYTLLTTNEGASSSVNFQVCTIGEEGVEIIGHKIYIRGGSSSVKIRAYANDYEDGNGLIFTVPSSYSSWPRIFVSSGTIITTPITVYPQYIDLTLLGIDNLTTVTEVEAWLAEHVGTKPYYTYNAGTILSAQTLGIKTYGQNLLNPTTKQAKLIPYTWEENSNVYTIKNVPSGATATFTPDNTGVAVTVDISGGSLDITSYGSGILELSAATANTYVCMKWDEQKDDDIVPFEEHTQEFDVRKVYGKVNGAGEYVQCFPNGMRSAGTVHDTLTASEAVVNILEYTFDTPALVTQAFATYTKSSQMRDVLGSIQLLQVPLKRIESGVGSVTMAWSENEIGMNVNYNGVGADVQAYMSGKKMYFYAKTPITYTDLIYRDGGIDKPLSDVLVNINVNNWGIEEQLLTPYDNGNPTSTAATITMEYKSNFKDAIKDLIDKVNNQKNPVMGVSNTGQTVDKIAIYDSASTVHSSSYSPSNATIVEGATGNNIILPSVEALTTYVNTKLSSALNYKGTIAQWSDLPTSGQSVGDMYIASTTFTEQGTTYNAGDFFIWNGSSWDIVSGTTSVDDKDVSLVMNGTRYTIATVDGNSIHVTTPDLNASDPTVPSSGTTDSLSFIDSVSQSNGLISATKKTVGSASTSQKGVVQLSNSIESTSSEDSKVPTAYETLGNLNNRDVSSGTITNDIATLTKRMYDNDSTSQTYQTWINKTFYPTTKFGAINDFSTGFATNYPDLAAIEALGTSSPTSGFPKRASDGTWSLTEDTGKMKWLDEVTRTYGYSAASTNDEELGSYIHNYSGVTTVEKATVTNDSNKYGFRIDVPLLTSSGAVPGTVLKGRWDSTNHYLPTWGQLSIEELDELDNLSTGTGYLRRKAGTVSGYEWELSTPDSTTVDTIYNDGTSVSDSTTNAGIYVTTNGTPVLHKVPFSAIVNDTSTSTNAVTIILNGNFS